MSLNGLDATDVNEAYLAALGEGGGWFLLQYAGRAEVGLLRKGTGGIQELKETVNHYIEQSPLYGFVQYRRRKVLLKYVPEGTSRLLQARLAVHFQSVVEKFSPHDTIFSFTAPSELIDSALSAACSLHTAPASIKSSTSLRRKCLAEITEDASENQTLVSPISNTEPEIVKASDVKDDDTRLDRKPDTAPSPPVEPRSSPVPSSRTVWNTDKALPPTPDSLHEDEKTKQSIDHDGFPVRTSFEGRQSSQSARPTTREGYSGYEYKPKVRLGPRPSIDSNAGIPSSDPTSRAYDPRPVATLPASVRMPARKVIPPRPVAPRKHSTPNFQPSLALNPIVTSSVVSNNSSTASAPTTNPQPPTPKPIGVMSARLLAIEPKTPAMTPEKKRLMKALELRQKQLAAQKKQQLISVEGTTNQLEHNSATKPVKDDELSRSPVQAAEALATPDYLQNVIGEDDSGIVRIGDAELMQSSSMKADISPTSMPEASDGPSTQASSISEEGSFPLGEETDHMTTASFGNADPTDGTPQSAKAEQKACDLYNSPNLNQLDLAVESKRLDELELQNVSTSLKEDLAAPQEHGLGQDDLHSRPIGGEDDGVTFPLQVEGATRDLKNIAVTRPLSGLEQAMQTPSSDTLRNQSSAADTPPRGGEQPLLRSMGHGTDIIYPHEVPLPAIGEDEEKGLSPQEAASSTSTDIAQPISPRESSIQFAPRTLYQPTEEDDRAPYARTSAEIEPSASDTGSDRHDMRQNKRHGLIEPVRRISSGENSDDQFLSDDSFMEELTSATVQEAKPISVSKSPITPVFPRSLSEQGQESKANRSVSTPLEISKVGGDGVSPQSSTLLPPRSVSVNKPRPTSPSDNSPPMLGKVAVSSGISQRIKALEKLQSRPLSPSQISSSPNAPPLFSSFGSRKSSFRSRPGTPDRPHSRQAKLALSPVLSPTTNFEVKQPKPYNQFVSVKVASKPGKSRPDSISVTARIVRDEWNQTPEVPYDASQPCAMDLHQSPLKVEHKSADAKSSFKKPPMKRHSTAPSVSSNSTDQRSEPMSYSKRDSIVSASNYSRRGSDTELPRSASEISLSGMNGGDGVKEERKESRKSRLLKRMSNSMAASRRSIATALSPPPVREESIAEQHEPIQEVLSAFVEIGDVNIQFPDTLLWKRRHMAIDAQGIVVLSPSQADSNSRVVTKRYDLTEFFPPYIPDQDRQEMPNSVNLDFKDGSTLQCACQNLAGQAQVLGALTHAHNFHSSK